MRRAWLLLWLGLTALAPGLLPGAEHTPGNPSLVLDAGGHTGAINAVVFTPDGKELITVSDDRTIRTWDVHSGEALSVFHPPEGPGSLIAEAIAPDGRLLAVGRFAETDVQNPVLLIDLARGSLVQSLPGHTGAVEAVAFSRDGRRLASAGSDQIVRIWDTASGQLLHELRGHRLHVHGLAFSPDGRWLASASMDGTGRIWSVGDGREVSVLESSRQGSDSVAWSADGRTIALGNRDATLQLWNADGTLRKTLETAWSPSAIYFSHDQKRILITRHTKGLQRNLPAKEATGPVPLGFSTDTRIGQSIYADFSWFEVDSGRELVRNSVQPVGIIGGALAPDESLGVTIGGEDNELYLWRTATGEIVHRMVGRGRHTWYACWSRDSQELSWWTTQSHASTTTLSDQRLEHHAFHLSDFQLRKVRHPIAEGSVVELPNPTELRSRDQTLGKLEAGDRARVREIRGRWLYVDYDPKARYDGVAAVADVLKDIYPLEPDPADVDLPAYLRPPPGEGTGAPLSRDALEAPPRQAASGWIDVDEAVPVDDQFYYEQRRRGALSLVPLSWGGVAVRHGNKTAAVMGLNNDRFKGNLQAVSFAWGQQVAASGTFLGPALYDSQTGQWIRTLKGHVSHVCSLAPSPDGRYLLSASHDQTIRVWTADRQEPLFSLFVAGDDWVAWTPEGEYAASPGGERLMGWLVGRDAESMKRFLPAGQFHSTLYRPQVLRRLAQAGSLERAREVVGEQSPPPVAAILPPVVVITTPDRNGLTTSEPELTVRAVARGYAGRPVSSMQLLVDGRPYSGELGRRNIPAGPETRGAAPGISRDWDVVLSPGTHRLVVEAESAASKGLSEPIDVTYTAPRVRKPRLYVLAIGISQYPAPLSLRFAAKDAEDFTQALRAKSAPLFDSIQARVLTDDKATRRAILGGLGWLKESMTEQDIGIIFYAGHGKQDDIGEFYLVPVDVETTDLPGTGVPGSQYRNRLAGIKGRLLVLLDACHSGAFGNAGNTRGLEPLDDLVRRLASNDAGVIVMSASTDREFAREDAAMEQGFFTKALIEGLSGAADINHDHFVFVTELEAYVFNRVSELTQDHQHPATAKPSTIQPFALSRP